MAPSSSKQRAEAEVLDLKGKLRQLNKAVADKGATIDENAPLVATIKAMEGLKVGGEEGVLTLYKPEQFYKSPDEKLPPLKVKEGANVSLSRAFADMKALKKLPEIDGIDRATDISNICEGCSSITSATLGNMPLVSDASHAFHRCSAIERITIGDLIECTGLEDFMSNSPKLRSVEIGNCPKVKRINGFAYNCPALESIRIGLASKIVIFNETFNGCKSLRTIEGILDLTLVDNTSKTTFRGCTSLEEVRIKGLKISINLADCQRLSMESVRYLVENAQTVTSQSIDLSRKLLETHEEELGDLGDTASDKGWTFNYR